MRLAALTTAAVLLGDAALAQPTAPQRPSGPVQQRIAPGLAAYTDEVLFGQVWPGAGLSQRDRSLVVISTLIATNKPAQLQGHLGRALGNGVTPIEASGVLTHLALYSGWPNAVQALAVYDEVYKARNIDLASLQAVRAPLAAVAPVPSAGGVAAFAPGFARLNDEVVFGDLWRRADLSLRDRSLVTIAALAASGDTDKLDVYLRRGVDAGLTRAQIGEALTHLAFYAGWPRATKALEIAAAALPAPVAQAPRPAGAGSSNFTGQVAITEPFSGTGGARLGGATVTFTPGARTNWHSHPLGQLLVVTRGQGRTQIDGQAVRELKPGDVVWTPPGARHWHGAAPGTAMTHVAIAETLEGRAVEWMEPVSDEQYRRGD